MEIKGAYASIHNKFDIFELDATTMGVIGKYKAENIVLDRMFTRLCAFNPFFNNIVFGSGTGTLSVGRTTLFNRIGYKAAETTELIRAYPTSILTRKIRLGADEYNGLYIREVGISDDSTSINTHAFIADSEGQPLEIEKTNQKIVDIYATTYINLYNVDWGLFWYGNGLRDYLTGGSIGSEQIGISYAGNNDDIVLVSGQRTNSPTEKWVKSLGTFSELMFNKDVKYIDWLSTGLRCVLPRTGVLQNDQRTGVVLGMGDGTKKTFPLPNKNIKNLVVYVDGNVASGYDSDLWTSVVFDTAPAVDLIVSADYKCNFIPKDDGHILRVKPMLQFGVSKAPDPLMPDYVLPEGIPGEQDVIKGDLDYGYFGVVSANDFISGDDLCDLLGLTAGISQFSDAGWLKYSVNGKPLFVAKKTIRRSISWDNINAVGAIFGDKILVLNGIRYAVRLLSTLEWDRLIYPVHIEHYGGAPAWDDFTNADLQIAVGNGYRTWTSTLYSTGTHRVVRGDRSVSYSSNYSPDNSYGYMGFRPVLEVL